MDIKDSAISVRKLTKKFGEQTILDNLNFEVESGKITTILGFSGAGKSTLLKHLLGLLSPTSGEVVVMGQNLAGLTELELRDFRRVFGILFQYAALFDSMSAWGNVAFPLTEFSTLNEYQIETKVEALLKSVGIGEESYEKLPAELSGGMRKRVGLARALALNPSIMLYDEPTTGLDPITTKMVNDLIVDTANNYQVTSVIISHDVKASLKISDYVAFLDHGKIIEYQTAANFEKTTNPLIRKFLDL